MKKQMFALALSATMLMACGNNTQTPQDLSDSSVVTTVSEKAAKAISTGFDAGSVGFATTINAGASVSLQLNGKDYGSASLSNVSATGNFGITGYKDATTTTPIKIAASINNAGGTLSLNLSDDAKSEIEPTSFGEAILDILKNISVSGASVEFYQVKNNQYINAGGAKDAIKSIYTKIMGAYSESGATSATDPAAYFDTLWTVGYNDGKLKIATGTEGSLTFPDESTIATLLSTYLPQWSKWINVTADGAGNYTYGVSVTKDNYISLGYKIYQLAGGESEVTEEQFKTMIEKIVTVDTLNVSAAFVLGSDGYFRSSSFSAEVKNLVVNYSSTSVDASSSTTTETTKITVNANLSVANTLSYGSNVTVTVPTDAELLTYKSLSK